VTTSDTILPTVVIGAGIVGVATALSLTQRGRSVTVIERLPGPAELCSRANAGILAVGHAKAWAGPDAIGQDVQYPGPITVMTRVFEDGVGFRYTIHGDGESGTSRDVFALYRKLFDF
jgi:2-polyprenyl-6-methoxyphenol hydroxylase-like FAD-dependent oxidoreductase